LLLLLLLPPPEAASAIAEPPRASAVIDAAIRAMFLILSVMAPPLLSGTDWTPPRRPVPRKSGMSSG
jgi:hypothetical protein